MIMISIKDRTSSEWYGPELVHSVEQVKRYYKSMLPEKSLCRRFPEDFEVYKLGTFDERTGAIEVCKPERIYTMCEILEVSK